MVGSLEVEGLRLELDFESRVCQTPELMLWSLRRPEKLSPAMALVVEMPLEMSLESLAMWSGNIVPAQIGWEHPSGAEVEVSLLGWNLRGAREGDPWMLGHSSSPRLLLIKSLKTSALI